MIQLLPLLVFCLLSACGLNPIPKASPPLRSMEEPLALKEEPKDERERQKLAAGCFSGLQLRSAWFEEPLEPGQNPDALEVIGLIENSPAQAARLRVGDLLLSVTAGSGQAQTLNWPGQWRELELEAKPGTELKLRYDRAGVESQTKLVLTQRIRPAKRVASERFREEQHAGIVVRTATEVEARGAKLGSGGGAVLVGMSARSPFRGAKLQFGDLITSVNGLLVHHPQVLLSAIRNAGAGSLNIDYRRSGSPKLASAKISLSRRSRGVTNFDIPVVFHYSAAREQTEISLLYGLIGYESTSAAAEYTLLWLISWRTGDRDRLVEVGR